MTKSVGSGAGLGITGLGVEFGSHAAVVDVDLTLPRGEVMAVLGPSGCGKSTLLRAVAGLEPLAAGAISWAGEDLAGVPTHRRRFALMFQDGQLFDHLSVARNVGYGWRPAPAETTAGRRTRGSGRAAARRDIADLLELVGLGGYGDRMPRTLSGGERQRVALARSLAARPRLLLLDEPLSALDAALRTRLAKDVRQILTDSGSTALLVTHDQEEAFNLADRLAVMRDGRVVQHGSTRQVWSAPADVETARFLGFTRIVEGTGALLLSGGGSARVAVRPAGLVAGTDGQLAATVVSAVATPDGARLVVQAEGIGELDAVGPAGWHPATGDDVRLKVIEASIASLQ